MQAPGDVKWFSFIVLRAVCQEPQRNKEGWMLGAPHPSMKRTVSHTTRIVSTSRLRFELTATCHYFCHSILFRRSHVLAK